MICTKHTQILKNLATWLSLPIFHLTTSYHSWITVSFTILVLLAITGYKSQVPPTVISAWRIHILVLETLTATGS